MKNGVSNANIKKKGFDNDKPNNSFSRASITLFLVLSLAVGHCTTTR